jgi:S-adenosylmethionine synthetase
MAELQIYTSESVSEGHPDKLADQVSDALLDEALAQDPTARVAIETLVTHGMALIAGELTMEGYIDMPEIVKQTIRQVGYTHTDMGFDAEAVGVLTAVHEQSPDIAMGVDRGGAGDQGMMFGLAANETDELMPLPISMAHALTKQAADVRKEKGDDFFRPDAKAQVSVVYEDDQPKMLDTVVLSVQHRDGIEQEDVRARALEEIIHPVLTRYADWVDTTGSIKYHINPTGKFVTGGPQADTGLTGRKVIVDTYGGLCPHGGGAFSGKDPTKVDRSAAYCARHASKCVVAAGLADKCQIALAYAIGVVDPVSVHVETYGTEKIDKDKISEAVRAVFDLTPNGIIESLGLRTTKYLPTAKNGHFGNPDFPWESTAKASDLRQFLGT